jgi:chromosome segregation ATPase
MSYNFDRIKQKVEHGTGHQWTSYSDLFLVLSVTFLLLYVVANLRSGAATMFVQGRAADQAARIVELEKQLKAYEVLKADYAEKGASKDEVEMYRELEDHLSLLEKEAKSEYDDAQAKARDAQLRFNGLNKYQSLVKNIINANMVSASKSKRQIVMLDDREKTIDSQEASLRDLEKQRSDQEQTIAQNNEEIAQIQKNLENKEKALKNMRNASREERQRLEETLAKERYEGQMKITALSDESKKASAKIAKMEGELDARTREAERLMTEMQAKAGEHERQVAALKAQAEQEAAAERAKFEGQLKNARMTAAQKAAAEKALSDKLAHVEKELGGKLASLQGDLEGTRKGLKSAEERYGNAVKALQQAKSANDNLKSDLNASLEKLNAQRRLAQQVRDKLKKAGVEAIVDEKTGDVTVSFGDEYFETGQSELKPGMKDILQKTIPAYANGLFQDAKIAQKLENIEILGFASPTFKGRVVDPQSLDPADRQAVNFNMDLSYRRAKTIFDYMFDQNKIRFDRQKDLLPLVKVSGRSYLSAERLPASKMAPGESYCSKFDCKKHQIVVIRFNLKN